MSMIARSTGCPERTHAGRSHIRRLRALPSLLLSLVFLAPPLSLVRAQAPADGVSADSVAADRVSTDAPGWVRERPERVDGEPARVVVSDPLQRGQLADLSPMEIPAQLVRTCVRESYASTRATSLGTMQEVYQLVVLDANVRAQLQDRIRGQQVHRRLTTVGWASVAIAAAVALLHGQLRYRARRVSNPAAPHRPS
jgi:hypothetical protein